MLAYLDPSKAPRECPAYRDAMQRSDAADLPFEAMDAWREEHAKRCDCHGTGTLNADARPDVQVSKVVNEPNPDEQWVAQFPHGRCVFGPTPEAALTAARKAAGVGE